MHAPKNIQCYSSPRGPASRVVRISHVLAHHGTKAAAPSVKTLIEIRMERQRHSAFAFDGAVRSPQRPISGLEDRRAPQTDDNSVAASNKAASRVHLGRESPGSKYNVVDLSVYRAGSSFGKQKPVRALSRPRAVGHPQKRLGQVRAIVASTMWTPPASNVPSARLPPSAPPSMACLGGLVRG